MRTAARPIACLAVAAACALLFGLGATDLWAPDEPRYAAVAEELRSFRHGVSGLALLHLNGDAYTQKPPLYFWAAAILGAPCGAVTETVARLPSALCGLATVLLLAGFGARLLGPTPGWLGGAVLLSAFEFIHRARRAQLDVMLTLFETLALVAFWRLVRGQERRRLDLAVLHGALGLAVLTKGPVGFLVPVLVITATLASEHRLRALRDLAPPWALALSLGPGLVWTVAALALAPEGTLSDAVGVNLFGRYLAGTSHARPFWYFLYQFPVSFLPWTLLWPLVAQVAVRRVFRPDGDPERRRAWRFLLLWIGVSFAFFTLSAGKRGLYLLPAFPAAALLCADAVRDVLGGGRNMPIGLRRALAATACALPLVAVAATIPAAAAGVDLPLRYGVLLATAATLALLAWQRAATRPDPGITRVVVVAAAVLAAEVITFTVAFPALDAAKSPRPVAISAAALTPPGEAVGLASKATLVGGLLYYGGRPVRTLDDSDAVKDFVRRGGRAIVVPEDRLGLVERGSPVAIHGRFRSGSRTLLVVTPSGEPRHLPD
ncbi:MAG: ArnT family glycosyltransferase [Myxococcota bacterium]